MEHVQKIVFYNQSHHPQPSEADKIVVYNYQGNLYYRKGRQTPKLIAGTLITETSYNNGHVNLDIRSGRTTISTGTTYVPFSVPMGVTGTDYEVHGTYVRDNTGAEPSWEVGGQTKFGFYVTVYDNNITFGWIAILHTQ